MKPEMIAKGTKAHLQDGSTCTQINICLYMNTI